jgi:hypothetical protein
MKKLLLAAALALTLATPSFAFFKAFGLIPCGLCCRKCCTTFCVRPYNAFTPACCPNFCCNWGGPGGYCGGFGGDGHGGYVGDGMALGQVPVESIQGAIVSPSTPPAPAVTGPITPPMIPGHTSLMAPNAMPYGGVQTAAYNPMMYPGYNPMMAPSANPGMLPGYGMMPMSVPAYWYGR